MEFGQGGALATGGVGEVINSISRDDAAAKDQRREQEELGE